MPQEMSLLAPVSPPAPQNRSGAFHFDRAALQTLLLGAIAGVLILGVLDNASVIAVPTVLAVLCAIALAPLARRLERRWVPPTFAAALIVAGLLLGAGSTIYSLAPSAEVWNSRVPQILREVERRARKISSGFAQTADEALISGTVPKFAWQTAPSVPEDSVAASPDDAVGKLVDGGQRLVADWALGAPGLAAGAVYWTMLTFFLLRDRQMLARWLLSLVSGASTRRAVGRAMRDVRSDVARYLLTISVINLGLGVSTAAAFWLIGVENAPLWGVAVGLLNFMPFIGAAIMALVTLGVGLVSFADPVTAFAPLAVVLTLNTIEGQIVTPMLVGARVQLPAITIFVAIAFGAWLWGGPGALVATPVLIVAAAFVRRLRVATSHPHPRSRMFG